MSHSIDTHYKIRKLETPTISSRAVGELKWRAMDGAPFEICGIMQGVNLVVPLKNTLVGEAKRHGFDMETNAVYPDVHAIWHSHPNGPLVPSETDINMMQILARNGFQMHHIIVTPTDLAEWIIYT